MVECCQLERGMPADAADIRLPGDHPWTSSEIDCKHANMEGHEYRHLKECTRTYVTYGCSGSS